MQVTIEVNDKRIADLLCSAFEGGSNYWYRIEQYIAPPADNLYKWDTDTVYRRVQYPMSVGGALVISDAMATEQDNVSTGRLDRESIARGLQLFAQGFNVQHFGNWMAERDDAETGDVFLQLCLFGEVVYG